MKLLAPSNEAREATDLGDLYENNFWRRGLRTLAGAVTALVIGAGAVVVGASAAQAAEVDAVSAMTSTPSAVLVGQSISVCVEFTVPNTAKAGDIVTIALDSHVEGQPRMFAVNDRSGLGFSSPASIPRHPTSPWEAKTEA